MNSTYSNSANDWKIIKELYRNFLSCTFISPMHLHTFINIELRYWTISRWSDVLPVSKHVQACGQQKSILHPDRAVRKRSNKQFIPPWSTDATGKKSPFTSITSCILVLNSIKHK